MAAGQSTVSGTRLVLSIGLYFLLGTPLVAYLWHTLNHLFGGDFRPVQVLLAVPAAVLLYLLLRSMARTISGWEGERHGAHGENREGA